MPGGDRTGPAGQGPMTGRGAGFCAGSFVGGYANPTFRLGFGGGFRGGRGLRGRGLGRQRWGGRNWPDSDRSPDLRASRGASAELPEEAPVQRESRKAQLERRLAILQSQVASIQGQLSELDSAGAGQGETS